MGGNLMGPNPLFLSNNSGTWGGTNRGEGTPDFKLILGCHLNLLRSGRSQPTLHLASVCLWG